MNAIPFRDQTLIGQLPDSERPRERLLKHGAAVLSDRELLALIFGTGPRGVGALGLADRTLGLPRLAAEDRLRSVQLRSGDTQAWVEQLGPAQAARLMAALELSQRFQALDPYKAEEQRTYRPNLNLRARKLIPPSRRKSPKEWIGWIAINGRGKMSRLTIVAEGSHTFVHLSPSDLFRPLLNLAARGFFIFHNHPSGDPTPSRQDEEFTHRLRAIAEELDLKLLGHWVVSENISDDKVVT